MGGRAQKRGGGAIEDFSVLFHKSHLNGYRSTMPSYRGFNPKYVAKTYEREYKVVWRSGDFASW